jgi:hypothetical protein
MCMIKPLTCPFSHTTKNVYLIRPIKENNILAEKDGAATGSNNMKSLNRIWDVINPANDQRLHSPAQWANSTLTYPKSYVMHVMPLQVERNQKKN